jgi:hypothetical protein
VEPNTPTYTPKEADGRRSCCVYGSYLMIDTETAISYRRLGRKWVIHDRMAMAVMFTIMAAVLVIFTPPNKYHVNMMIAGFFAAVSASLTCRVLWLNHVDKEKTNIETVKLVHNL